ncbi:MAG: N-formimino-L-glutamate deiminase [Caulobacter sp.]|nr:N-formimino-L-glutamate deiminase [Caulobacter sp.]
MSSLWFERTLVGETWADRVRLTLDGGLITGIVAGADPEPEDERHATAIPGLSNVHSHGFQRGMAGLTEYGGAAQDDFWSWRELMYRFLDHLDPDDVEAITAQAYVEMLQTGFTRVGEFHYLHHDPAGHPYGDLGEMAGRIAAAAAATGIGLTLLPVHYAHGGFGGAPAAPGQRRFLNTVDAFAALYDRSRAAIAALPDANLGVAPHSLRAVTPDELRDVVSLEPTGPIHIHAAEQVREVSDCIAWSGRRPVQWLLDEMALDQRWCLVHATHLDSSEVERLAASGAVAGLCPVTEANLGDGIFPAQAYLAASGAMGIGTDSNILIDPAQELRMIEYAQRLTLRARNVLGSDRPSTGARLFVKALTGGAQALGQASHGLNIGASADIVSLAADHPSTFGRQGDALLDSWIFAGTAGVVDTVWRRGAKVVVEGRHHQADAVAARYRRTLRKLLAA